MDLYDQNRECAFESWWQDNRSMMELCNVTKGLAKSIFARGWDFGYDHGYDNGI